MLVQDTGAFVEILELPQQDKQAVKRRRQARAMHVQTLRARLDVRLFEQALMAMERAAAGDEPKDSSRVARRATPGPPSEKDLKAVRAGLERARTKAAARAARTHSIKSELVDDDGRERTTRWYRLHTEVQHFEWSEEKFARLAGAQRTWPVRVATLGRVRWWWYLDRFWSEDEGLRAEHVRGRVLDDDRQRVLRRRAQRRALEDALAPRRVDEIEPAGPALARAARGAEGCCVDCGSDVDVVFDARDEEGDAGPIVELRCVSCRSRRLEAEPKPSVGRRRLKLPWRHDELLPWSDDPAERAALAGGGSLPSVWVVSPEDADARRSS